MIIKTITRKITSKGQITIPQEIRDILGSDIITFEIGQGNTIKITPVAMSLEEAFGSVPVPNHLENKTEQEIQEILQDEVALNFQAKNSTQNHDK